MTRTEAIEALVADLEPILMNGYFTSDQDAGMRFRRMKGDDLRLREKVAAWYDQFATQQERTGSNGQSNPAKPAAAGQLNGAKPAEAGQEAAREIRRLATSRPPAQEPAAKRA